MNDSVPEADDGGPGLEAASPTITSCRSTASCKMDVWQNRSNEIPSRYNPIRSAAVTMWAIRSLSRRVDNAGLGKDSLPPLRQDPLLGGQIHPPG